jgi:hypothetical protein
MQLHYEKYEKLTYRCKDGTEKEKKDFVTVHVTLKDWLEELRKFWPKFIGHHNSAKWHDDDFAAMRTKLRRRMVCAVIDYAQNYAHEPRYENQSKYFSQVMRSCAPNQHARMDTSLTCPARSRAPDSSQVQSTLVPVVLVMHVEDLTNITDERRAELIAYFDEHDLPHVITETHFVISSDLQHDTALIQKIFDDFITPYLKTNAPSVNELHVRSDGCKVRNCPRFHRRPSCLPRLTVGPLHLAARALLQAQFKCAANFWWVSRQSKVGSGIRTNWTFFESCHGKCYCDPEGGTLKNAARQGKLRARVHVCKSSEELYDWAVKESRLATTSQELEAKGGRGIFRRFFYYIPSKGVGAVDRSRLAKFKAEGTSLLHEFVDIGVEGTVSTRRAACHMCDHCWADERRSCENIAYTGAPKELTIVREKEPVTSLSRVTRSQLNQAGLERAAGATVGSNVCVETHNSE